MVDRNRRAGNTPDQSKKAAGVKGRTSAGHGPTDPSTTGLTGNPAMATSDNADRAGTDRGDANTGAAMEELKWEVAERLGLDDDLQDPDELTVREAGKVGGQMVKKLIEKGKEAMAGDQETRR